MFYAITLIIFLIIILMTIVLVILNKNYNFEAKDDYSIIFTLFEAIFILLTSILVFIASCL